VLNIVLRPHDTWAICAYDERTLTDEMIADLHATHPPLIAHDHHHLRNDRYQPPGRLPQKHSDHPPDPVERTNPAVELVDPSPAAARATVAGVARRHRLRPRRPARGSVGPGPVSDTVTVSHPTPRTASTS
jgi:hypothetical protein